MTVKLLLSCLLSFSFERDAVTEILQLERSACTEKSIG